MIYKIADKFKLLWFKLIYFYDSSFCEKIISSVCNFFIRASENSFICNLFKSKEINEFWESSVFFKVLYSPVRLCELFYEKIGKDLKEKAKENSFILFVKNIFYISLLNLGLVIFSISLGTLIPSILVKDKFSVIVSAIFVFISLLFMILKKNMVTVLSNSLFLSFIIKSIGFDVPKEKDDYKIKNLYIVLPVLFLVSLFFSFLKPVVFTATVLFVVGFTFLCIYPVVGAFIFVFFAPILPTLAVAGLVGICILAFIVSILFGRKYHVSKLNFPIVLFLAIATVSTLFGVDKYDGLKIVAIYILFALSYSILVSNIKTFSMWKSLLITFTMSALLVSLYGIYQNFTVSSTTSLWVDQNMFSGIEKRVFATLDNPNILGEFLICALPVAFSVLCAFKDIFKKFIYTLVNIAMFLCLIYTWSRGAWLGVILALGFFVLLNDRRWLMICFIGLILTPTVLPQNILERFTSIGNLKDESSAYRVSIWIASFRLAKDVILSGIGVGSGAFSKIYPSYALDGAGFALHAHNFFIQLVVEMGIWGLLSFFYIIFYAYKLIYKGIKNGKQIRLVLLGAGGSLLGLMFSGMFENLWYNYRMILVFFILLSIISIGSSVKEDDDVN